MSLTDPKSLFGETMFNTLLMLYVAGKKINKEIVCERMHML